MNLKFRSTHWIMFSLIYTAATFVVSSLPGTAFPAWKIQHRLDLVLHFIEYGILAWLLLRFFDAIDKLEPWFRTTIVITLFCGLIGGLNELWQKKTPGRYASISDEIANIAGVVVVILLYRLRKLTNSKQ